MSDQSLINIGELAKPATALIEKISSAVGVMFEPVQIVRVARAEAEAELIRAEAQIQVSDLQRRAAYRFIEEEGKKQLNMEGITQRALPLLEEKSDPGKVATDWITNFFDKSRIVSNNDMQALWSRVLAGEANAPGTFSRKTVNLLGDLDKSDAQLFTMLCGFGWAIGQATQIVPLIFDVTAKIYNENGVSFNTLSHLESLGLIQFNNVAHFQFMGLPQSLHVSYFGTNIELTLPGEAHNALPTGTVMLTRAGLELARICGSKPVGGFLDFVYDEWARSSFVPKHRTK